MERVLEHRKKPLKEHMNVGLIGYGFMGGAHLAALAAMPGVTVTALACRTRPGAEPPTQGNMALQTVTLPAATAWRPDWQSVVEDPAIDAVDICLPTPLHLPVALSALAHGKHVLCEKPMALTVEDCDRMLAAAADAGRVLMVAQVLRFMAPYRDAAEFVQAEAARVARCTLRRTTGYPHWSEWLADPRRSGGAVLDLLSHDLDQALSWFGPPQTVSAVSLGAVDTARATLVYGDGPQVVVEGGWLAPGAEFAQSFVLEAGDDSLMFDEGRLRRVCDDVTADVSLADEDAYAAEIAYFLDCCRRGAAPLLCPPEASAAVVRLATLVRKSRERGGEEMRWS